MGNRWKKIYNELILTFPTGISKIIITDKSRILFRMIEIITRRTKNRNG